MADGRDPLVSVVIPCFNQARFLAASLGSVKRQRYAPLEILVVDDGSSDDTATQAAGLGAQVIRQSNRGVSAARNTGLAAARGEFVVCLDADDELMDGAIARGVATLRDHPEAACAVGRCVSIDHHGSETPAGAPDVDRSDLYRTWLSRNFVWAPAAALFRRSALIAIGGFPSGVDAAADYAVYLALARTGRVVDHGQAVARYRQHGDGMSRDAARMLRETETVLRAERQLAPARYAADFARGIAAWREWYGEQIVDQLRHEWGHGRLTRSMLRAVATLLRHAPATAFRHVARKCALTLGLRAPSGAGTAPRSTP